MSKLYRGHITNWSLCRYGEAAVIIGVIKENAAKEEHFIRTSAVQILTPNMVETLNSIYTLDEMAKP